MQIIKLTERPQLSIKIYPEDGQIFLQFFSDSGKISAIELTDINKFGPLVNQGIQDFAKQILSSGITL